MIRRHTRIAAGLAAIALPLALLVGCSDDPVPKIPEEPSSSPTEAEPSEPTEPTPPAAMERRDVAGAEAFVKYYFELLTFAVHSGETAPARAVALDDCASCRGALRAIERIHAAGGRVTGGAMVATDIGISAAGSPTDKISAFDGVASIAIDEQTIRGTGDAELDGTTQASNVDIQLHIISGPRGWTMAEWRQP